MAKFVFYVSTNVVGSKQEEVVEIPDEELEGLNEEERNKVVEEYYKDWLGNYSDIGWYEV